MIFVAVGTQKFPLDRLLAGIDRLVASGQITETVFAQTGYSGYKPENYPYERFLSKEAYEEAIARCDLLVTHSGVGTIMSGLGRGKPVVVFPRLAKYAEHVDDHQLEIADSFSRKNLVLLCADEGRLGEVLRDARTHVFDKYRSQRDNVVETIRTWLDGV